jgi:tRNA(Leu) C34 or U34 (ribose-2'-O)-methylase TrmL
MRRLNKELRTYNQAVVALVMLWVLVSGISMNLKAQTVLTASDDCYIYASGTKAGEPYGIIDPDSLKTRKSVSSDQFTRETYIKFQLGDLDTTYISAHVKLFGEVPEAKKVQIYFTDTAWQEETLTGNTRPAGTYIGELLLTIGQGYYSWEVTNYINQAVSEGRQSVAFIFKDVAGAVSTKDTKWHSKENASGNQPLLELVEGLVVAHRNGTYYIDFSTGNDNNTAASPDQAWKSLGKIGSTIFAPGDSVLLKAGESWPGQIRFNGSGASGNPILIGKYGSGSNPRLEGGGQFENTVQLTNQQFIEIQDLHITNFGDTVAFRRGIYVQAEDIGAVKHIILRRLEISDVNGSMDGEISKNNGGVLFDVTGSGIPTYFDTLVVEDCYVHDVDRTGISNRSSWSTRTMTSDGDWAPSKNMVFRNNTFERTGANALIVRVAYKPLMEYNLFTNCAIKGSGNASFSFNTNYALWQHNEACFTYYNSGDEDAGGFDSDYNSKFTTLQYNYSHDNGYGAMLLTGGPGSNFNDGTIIRYNVMANNADHVIRTSGTATNSSIYNNTIFSEAQLTNIDLIRHKSWEGFSSNTKYYNNIFQAMGTGAGVDLGSSTGNVFDYNLFYGPAISNIPADAHKISLDPQLNSPYDPGSGTDSLTGFRLKVSSPAINSGMAVPGSPGFDFEGNAVPINLVVDRGAFEYTGTSGIADMLYAPAIKVYPNPASKYIRLEADNFGYKVIRADFLTLDNKLVFSREFSISGNILNVMLPLGNPELSPGIYILKIDAGMQTIQKTLISVQ